MFVSPKKVVATTKTKGTGKGTVAIAGGKRLKITGWECKLTAAGCNHKAMVWVCQPPGWKEKKRAKAARLKKRRRKGKK